MTFLKMFNQILFNEAFNDSPIPLELTEDDLVYNGYGLQNDSISTSFFNPVDTNDVEYNAFNIPQDDGKGFISRFWRERTLVIRGTIKSTTANLMNDKIDEFKREIGRNTEAVLKYKVNGVYRQIKATCTDIKIPREHYHITFVPFEVTLKANDPFFYDSSNLTALFEWKTTATVTEEITNSGGTNSKLQTYFIFISATTVTTVSMTIGGIALTFTGTISTGDVLLFDCLNKEVRLNNVLQDYTGTFQDLVPGFNTIVYAIDGNYNADISNVYRKNYL